jgi:hypothetical protein
MINFTIPSTIESGGEIDIIQKQDSPEIRCRDIESSAYIRRSFGTNSRRVITSVYKVAIYLHWMRFDLKKQSPLLFRIRTVLIDYQIVAIRTMGTTLMVTTC